MTMAEVYRFVVAFIVALIAFGIAHYFVSRWTKPAPVIASFSLEQTISDIKRELQKLENSPGDRLGLELSEVEIALFVQQESKQSSDAGLTIPVFDETKVGTGGSVTAQSGSKVTVVLVPPRGSRTLASDRGSQVEFADLLIAARAALQRSLHNEPALDAKSIDVELAFVLTTTRSTSASVQAKLIQVTAGAEETQDNSNTITLKYVNPKYQEQTASGAASAPIPSGGGQGD